MASLSDRNPTWPPELMGAMLSIKTECLSDRNPTWPLEHSISYNIYFEQSLSDRTPTWPLEHNQCYPQTGGNVSVIVILHGHLNANGITKTEAFKVSVIVILRGHLNSK